MGDYKNSGRSAFTSVRLSRIRETCWRTEGTPKKVSHSRHDGPLDTEASNDRRVSAVGR